MMAETTVRRFEVVDTNLPLPGPTLHRQPGPHIPDFDVESSEAEDPKPKPKASKAAGSLSAKEAKLLKQEEEANKKAQIEEVVEDRRVADAFV